MSCPNCDYQENPITSIIHISRITKCLEDLLTYLRITDPARRYLHTLLKATQALPSYPDAITFGFYLENYKTLDAQPRLDLDVRLKEFGIPAIGAGLVKRIHATLREMTRRYLDKHIYNKVEVYRLMRRFVEISRQFTEAAYAMPSLASPFFNNSVSQLDYFTHQLVQLEKRDETKWSVPQWADVRNTCGMQESVYTVAVLRVGEIISAYAGEPDAFLPSHAKMSRDINVRLAAILKSLLHALDPFEGRGPWEVYSLLQGKPWNYYLPQGYL